MPCRRGPVETERRAHTRRLRDYPWLLRWRSVSRTSTSNIVRIDDDLTMKPLEACKKVGVDKLSAVEIVLTRVAVGYQREIDAVRSLVRHGKNDDHPNDCGHYVSSQYLAKEPEKYAYEKDARGCRYTRRDREITGPV